VYYIYTEIKHCTKADNSSVAETLNHLNSLLIFYSTAAKANIYSGAIALVELIHFFWPLDN